MSDGPNPLSQELDKVIRDAVGRVADEQLAVSRWALSVEFVDGMGRAIQTHFDPEMAIQDVLGLLRWSSLEVESAVQLAMKGNADG